ncbi:MAG: PQQ-binding-like beta-propeller repeat protein [Rhodospirillaceae bacterium]|nr:PQQ-binding-like beta-propeller repeat protein [Rhodospirillaceae bacterium]
MPKETRAKYLNLPCVGFFAALLLLQANGVSAAESMVHYGEWRNLGNDPGNTKYTPLDQIHLGNVSKLRILWRRPAVDPAITESEPDLNPIHNFRPTALMIDGVLYAPNGVGLVEAMDPGTGRTLWVQEPLHEGFRGLAGMSTRTVAYWSDGSERRILAARNDHLVSMNAATGRLDGKFGDAGKIDMRWEGWNGVLPAAGSAGPIVVGDLVIIGGSSGDDFGVRKEGPSEDVRAFDVRTGRQAWAFHVLPRPGEFGYDTWAEDPHLNSGGAGAWAALSADEELGFVYVATGSPNNTWYGGHRPGKNLFANSIVCLDARTGERVWHYQLVHHDLWDYDVAAAPVLADIEVAGKPVKAVIVIPKHGFVFVFDRVTGEPLWPIEERSVPASRVPGEKAWPTQPFPTKPAPVDRQGIGVDDLIDFTPELRAEAVEIIKPYFIGPTFTPPSVAAPGHTQGTITYPGSAGGVNWNGPAFDPETSMLYVPSFTAPWVNGLVRPPALADASIPYMHGPDFDAQDIMAACCEQFEIYGPDGLPLVKPPYGRITAIDLTSGATAWIVPNGDGPRDHPRLRHLNLPPLGQPGKTGALLTKTLLFIGDGSPATSLARGGGNRFRAYDKATGAVVWETELPAGTTGSPMSYLFDGKQHILVAIGGLEADEPPEWVALGLP